VVYFEDSDAGHGGNPVGSRVKPSAENHYLLDPGTEGDCGHIIDEASSCDGRTSGTRPPMVDVDANRGGSQAQPR